MSYIVVGACCIGVIRGCLGVNIMWEWKYSRESDSDGTVKHEFVLDRRYIGKNSFTFVDPDLGFLGLDD